MELFNKRVEEDGGNTDIKKYSINMGRFDAEIKDMHSRIEVELFDVLTPDRQEKFNLDIALERINKIMENVK